MRMRMGREEEGGLQLRCKVNDTNNELQFISQLVS